MPTITARTHLLRPAPRVWADVRDLSALARRAPHVVAVTPTGATTRWTVLLNGSEMTWEQSEVEGPGHVLRFEQVTGELESMSGTWEVSETEGGVQVGLSIDFELGVDGLAPLLEPMWIQSLHAHAEALLRGVPTETERS